MNTVAASPEILGVRRGVSRGWMRLRRAPWTLRIGVAFVACYVVAAIVGVFWTPYDPLDSVARPFIGVSAHHWLGTDVLGRDVFSRLLFGAREVLILSVFSTAISLVVGAPIGLASGYLGGVFDAVVMRTFEVVISIPFLMLALLVVAAAGPTHSGNTVLLIGAIVLIYAPRTARVARSVALDLVTRDFVTAARARGESAWSIVRRELLPNATGPLMVEFGVRAGYAPILIGSLAFLGFGVQPPTPDWGLMINENRAAIATAPLSVLAPAGALAGLVIALNLSTDGLARLLGRTPERSL